MKYTLENNVEESQYEFIIDGHIVKIEYKKKGKIIELPHTIVPKELSGKGIATELLKQVLLDIEKKSMIIVPICPFIVSYINKHPEWKRLTRDLDVNES